MKIWEADKSKRYVNQDGLVWFYDNVDWRYKTKEECDEKASPLYGMNWFTIELQDLTPIEEEKPKKKLYAYRFAMPNHDYIQYKTHDIDQTARAPEYDLEFE